MIVGILIFAAAIIVVVMAHEAGHFLVAKLFRFKATQFFLGFGPTLWSFKRGETEYGVKFLPLGGFVKIVGMNPYEEVSAEDEERSYPNKPRWQRALVLVAGSATHWVVAFALFGLTALTIGFPVDEPTNSIAALHPRIGGETAPAANAGFEPGDEIVGAGDRPTSSWHEISEYIKRRGNATARFTVKRDGEVVGISVRLGRAIFDSEGDVVGYAAPGKKLRPPQRGETVAGFLGVSPAQRYERDDALGAVARASDWTWRLTHASITGIPVAFKPVFNGDLWRVVTRERSRQPQDPFGLVGAGRIAGQSVERQRYAELILLIASFTIFLGVLNLLPLPPLDGGHLAVVGWEAITGRTVDVRKLVPVAVAVIAFFLVLFVTVLYLDLARPVPVPF